MINNACKYSHAYIHHINWDISYKWLAPITMVKYPLITGHPKVPSYLTHSMLEPWLPHHEALVLWWFFVCLHPLVFLTFLDDISALWDFQPVRSRFAWIAIWITWKPKCWDLNHCKSLFFAQEQSQPKGTWTWCGSMFMWNFSTISRCVHGAPKKVWFLVKSHENWELPSPASLQELCAREQIAQIAPESDSSSCGVPLWSYVLFAAGVLDSRPNQLPMILLYDIA